MTLTAGLMFAIPILILLIVWVIDDNQLDMNMEITVMCDQCGSVRSFMVVNPEYSKQYGWDELSMGRACPLCGGVEREVRAK